MERLRACAIACGVALIGVAAPAVAQDAAAPSAQQAILLIDPDQLFTATIYGKRVLAEIQAGTEALKAENQRIVEALTEEEQSLASRRSAMDPEVFRTEAAAFDEKTQSIRRAQDAKERDLQAQLAAARTAFEQDVRPLLARMMQERGASVLLHRKDVALYFDPVDITDAAVALIDADLGDGSETGSE